MVRFSQFYISKKTSYIFFMTTTYIVRFKQQVYCLISDNIVPKVTPQACNNAM